MQCFISGRMKLVSSSNNVKWDPGIYAGGIKDFLGGGIKDDYRVKQKDL